VVGQSRLLPYLLLAPVIPALGLLIVYPIISAVVVSLYRTKYLVPRPQDFAGLANYITLVSDPKFLNSLWVTAIYVAAFATATLALGMLFALLLDQRFPGRGIVRALITVPWATPMIASILVWTWMFDYQYGVINYFRGQLGLGEPILWLSDPSWALAAVIAVDVWRIFPFAVIVILTALQAVDATLYEAARIDGAGPLDLFRHVTLPGIRGTLGILTLLLVIWSLRRFETAWILTQGGPSGHTDLLVVNIYREAFRYHRPGYAAAMAVVGLAISLLIASIYFVRERRREAT
jgi:multiple sugar transport system permease protein